MAITVDFSTKVVASSASITDLVAFHDVLRDIEASDEGIQYPVIHEYTSVEIGGGAFFPSIKLINGYTLTMPSGSVEISGGNFDGTINNPHIVRVYNASSYAVTASGGGGTAIVDNAAIASAVWENVEATKLTARVYEIWTKLIQYIPTIMTTKKLGAGILSDIDVWLGLGNKAVIAWDAGLVTVNEATITRCKLSVDKPAGVGGAKVVIDSNDAPQYFELTNSAGLVLKLGNAGLVAGRSVITIVVYTSEYTGGAVFGQIAAMAKSV